MPQIHSGGNTQSLFYVRKKILFSSSSELCVTFRDDDLHFIVQLRVCRMTNKWTLKNTEWTDSLQILSQCKCFFVIMKLCRLVFSLMTDRREIIGYTAQVRSLSGSLISITSLLLHIVPPLLVLFPVPDCISSLCILPTGFPVTLTQWESHDSGSLALWFLTASAEWSQQNELHRPTHAYVM